MSGADPPRLDRREVLKWMAAAAASVTYLNCAYLPGASPPVPVGFGTGIGIGSDPDLNDPNVPWPRTLSAQQLQTTRALCDLILPADDRSPAASAVGVPDFIDEWISAPYEAHQQSGREILAGLAWIDGEAVRRFGKRFHELEGKQQGAICDEIAFLPRVAPELQDAARFFVVMRVLATGAFYTTKEGMRDIGYVGNVPLDSFDGPSSALRAHLGLD